MLALQFWQEDINNFTMVTYYMNHYLRITWDIV
jgi:hypothetical protein